MALVFLCESLSRERDTRENLITCLQATLRILEVVLLGAPGRDDQVIAWSGYEEVES